MDKSKKLMILLIAIGIVVIGVVVALSYGSGATLVAPPLDKAPGVVQPPSSVCRFEWICEPVIDGAGRCDFGQVPLGQSLSKPAFRLTNQSNQRSCSYTVSIDSYLFYCDSAPNATCNYTLAPNEVREMSIIFEPEVYGTINRNATISAPQGQGATYRIKGTGKP